MGSRAMPGLDEFDLRPEDHESPVSGPHEDRTFRIAILVAVLVVGGGLAGYMAFRARRAPAPSPAAATPRAMAAPIPEPQAAGLPSLDQSDGLLRELAKGLSPHAQLRLWLGQQGLARLFVNVVDIVSKGESPRASLGFLAPSGPFAVARRKGRPVIDDRSYARYDFFAEGVASVDAAACGQVFRRLLPLLEAAYRELGNPEGGFERALREGIAHLLETPVPEGEVGVKEVRRGNVVLYQYADPALEALSPAQKHLLRMGPGNVQRIQGTLRGVASALGQ